MSRNRSNKRAYKTLIMLTKPNHTNMMIIFDNNYTPLADNNGLMRRWTEYCNELKSEVRNSINTLTMENLLVLIIYPVS